MSIPSKAVEAAAEASRRSSTGGACGLNRACQLCDCGRDRFTAEDWVQDTGIEKQHVAYILESAAPYIAAQALRDAARELRHEAIYETNSEIREPKYWATGYLDNRADELDPQ